MIFEFAFFLHFVHSFVNKPVCSIISRPKRISCSSPIVSPPFFAKFCPSVSCLKRSSIGFGGAQGCFIRFSFSVMSFSSMSPQLSHRCFMSSRGRAVAYSVMSSFSLVMHQDLCMVKYIYDMQDINTLYYIKSFFAYHYIFYEQSPLYKELVHER